MTVFEAGAMLSGTKILEPIESQHVKVLNEALQIAGKFCMEQNTSKPRVMTLKEVKQADFGYLENLINRADEKSVLGTVMVIAQFQFETLFMSKTGLVFSMRHCEYGGKDRTAREWWRLWTARPSKTQREDTPWKVW